MKRSIAGPRSSFRGSPIFQAWTDIRLKADENWDPRFSTPGTPIFVDSTFPKPTTVSALAIGTSGEIVIAGKFADAGETKMNSIALWQDGHWSALGNGLDSDKDYVLALTSIVGGAKADRSVSVKKKRSKKKKAEKDRQVQPALPAKTVHAGEVGKPSKRPEDVFPLEDEEKSFKSF